LLFALVCNRTTGLSVMPRIIQQGENLKYWNWINPKSIISVVALELKSDLSAMALTKK
jgi:hypothetical protein